MKKIVTFSLAIAIAVISMVAHTSAEDGVEPLYRYVKKEDGSYGYDTSSPVYYYSGSNEKIQIPDTYTQQKHQFKSSWVATIFNIHFPQTSVEQEIKAAYTERLNTFEEWNMNAVIFQVRPTLDAAFYQSDINPASSYYTGTQGKESNYDPMPWMIEETHKRGMEFHAWFNPYRVTNSDYKAQLNITQEQADALGTVEVVKLLNEAGILANTNYAVLHPEYVLEFQGKLFLNPGEPAVVQHVVDTITEFMNKYDADAIHFDDYFYPYKGAENALFGQLNEDMETFNKYGVTSGYTDIEAWRRDNVTSLIDGVRSAIDTFNASNKRAVQFGISPFGIWEHKSIDERGSNTPQGSSKSYSETIFADTYQWVKDEKLDYIAPQIYWSFAAPAAPYGELLRWWNQVAEGTNVDVYVGHPSYKHEANGGWDADWMNPDEVNNQLKFNQSYSNISGSSIYSYNDLVPTTNNPLPKSEAKNKAIEILKQDTFSTPSLTPERPNLSHQDVTPVTSAKLENQVLHWTDINTNARFYVIYVGDEMDNQRLIENPKNIYKKVMSTGAGEYSLELTEELAGKNIAITVLDRAFVESDWISVEKTGELKPLEIEITNSKVELAFGQKLTEEEFIELLNIKGNMEFEVKTNFIEMVNSNVAGTYEVSVVVTPVSKKRAIQEARFGVTVIVQEDQSKQPEQSKDHPVTGIFFNNIWAYLGIASSTIGIFAYRKRRELMK